MADVSVRPARPADVPEIARIQLETWRTAYSTLPAEVLDAVSRAQAEAEWDAAVRSPPSPLHRVLVAQEGTSLVGFVAFGPTEPPSGTAEAPATIHTLLVEPRWGRRGHGSRLLAATVDQLRADAVDTATVWVLEGDHASESFFASAGWERDGSVRRLETDRHLVRQLRLHVSLAAPPTDQAAHRGEGRA